MMSQVLISKIHCMLSANQKRVKNSIYNHNNYCTGPCGRVMFPAISRKHAHEMIRNKCGANTSTLIIFLILFDGTIKMFLIKQCVISCKMQRSNTTECLSCFPENAFIFIFVFDNICISICRKIKQKQASGFLQNSEV